MDTLFGEFHQSHFIHRFTGRTPRHKRGTHTLCEPAQSNRTWRFHKSHFIRKFTGKMLRYKSGTHTFCERAQSKCTWRLHKSRVIRKFRSKMPPASWITLIKHRPLLLSSEPLSVDTLFSEVNLTERLLSLDMRIPKVSKSGFLHPRTKAVITNNQTQKARRICLARYCRCCILMDCFVVLTGFGIS